MVEAISESNAGTPMRTIENAVSALIQSFSYSPIGEQLCNCIANGKNLYRRDEYRDISNVALAYSIYRFAEKMETKSLRVNDFFADDATNGCIKEFALSKMTFEKGLRSLNSETNRVLIAELSMGLQHITLREDLTKENVIQNMLNL